MTNDMPSDGTLSTSRGQATEGTADGVTLGNSVPADPRGIPYDDDLFSSAGVSVPDEQTNRHRTALLGPDSMPSRYSVVARRYWDAGWEPLPLPPGAKFPPPTGYTGQTAYQQELTEEQVHAWIASKRISNVGLRMPSRVVALDVDAYTKGTTTKRGGETLTQLIEKYGPLPPTVSSSARDGVGGQFFYRLPDIGRPVILPGVPGPGIEAIQRHHRYSVVWPSQNPDAGDAVYRWRKPDPSHTGADWWKHWVEPEDEWFIPRVDDLPELPEAWCHLVALNGKAGVSRERSGAPLGTREIQQLLDGWNLDADLDPRLAGMILDGYQTAVTSGKARHDSCLSALTWAFKAGAAGLIDPQPVISTLESMFAADTHDRHVPGEFESMVGWAARNCVADGPTYRAEWERKRDEWRERRQLTAPEIPAQMTPPAISWDNLEDNVTPTSTPLGSGYAVVDDGEGGKIERITSTELTRQAAIIAGMNGEVPTEQAETPGETAEVKIPGLVPDEVWNKRKVLQQIRQAAHSRCASADVALYATLTRVSSMLDHRIVADVGQGHVTLNLFCGIVDNSGGGKSTGVDVSSELMVTPGREFLDDVTASTGEGITESFLGMVGTGEFHEKGPHKGEEKMERGQVRHNVFFSIDEGQTLINQGKKTNSILWPIIRSAWKSGTLSQQNATEDRKRKVGRMTYAMGLLVAFQEPNALEVLRDDETGTAQRFIWCQGSDPAIPRKRSQAPQHPGMLDHNPQLIEVPKGQQRVITFPDDICDRLWEEQAARKAGELVVDKLDTHANLMKMKLAGLMALLDMGRDKVTHEDWWIAEKLYEASCELRGHVLRKAEIAEKAAAEARRTEQVVTDAAKHAAKVDMDDKVLSVARWMYNRVASGKTVHPKLGKPTYGQLKQDAPGRNSKYLNAAFQRAEALGWLTVVSEETGEIAVGDSKPA